MVAIFCRLLCSSIQDSHSTMTDLPTINRIAVVLMPTQACLDWINSCPSDKPMTLAEIQEEPTVYLLPQSRGKSEQSVRRHFKAMFEEELYS